MHMLATALAIVAAAIGASLVVSLIAAAILQRMGGVDGDGL